MHEALLPCVRRVIIELKKGIVHIGIIMVQHVDGQLHLCERARFHQRKTQLSAARRSLADHFDLSHMPTHCLPHNTKQSRQRERETDRVYVQDVNTQVQCFRGDLEPTRARWIVRELWILSCDGMVRICAETPRSQASLFGHSNTL